jgi:glycosyltransferase involved in cell wall biosynthesis
MGDLMMAERVPWVSIVIPVYNGEDYIESAINSVLRQDYPCLELIVLDDGSTDDTRRKLKQYGERLHWQSHPNMGQAGTLNKGWAMSKGEILGYLSADDLLLPQAVSTSIRYLNSHSDAVMTYCDFNLIDPDSNIVRRARPTDFDYRDMVVNIVCPPGPGVFFRRQAFERAGGWNGDYRQMPDYDFWLRLGLVGRFLHIPEVLASFRVHNASQSFAMGDAKKSDEPIRIISEYFNKQSNIPGPILAKQTEALANAYLVSSQLHWRSGRYREAVRKTIHAVNIYPRIVLKKTTTKIILNAFFNRTGHRILWRIKRAYRRVSKVINDPIPKT